MSKKVIARATLLVTGLSVASKLLGFGRDQLIAMYFGASAVTDAYLVGMTLPGLVAGALGGPLGTPLIPVLTALWTQGTREAREKAWRVTSSILNLVLLSSVVITVIGIIFAPWAVRLLAPGFSGQTLELAILSARILFPSLLFLSLGAIGKVILNSAREFTLPALAPIAQNLLLIAALVFFARFGLLALLVGMLLATTWQVVALLPWFFQSGFRYHWQVDIKSPEIRRVGRLALPLLLGALVGQIYLVVDRGLASRLSEGSIAALSFADKIRQVPLGIFVAALSTVLFPVLSEMAARRDWPQFKDTIAMGLRLVAMITVPSAVGLIVLRVPIVRLLFQRGAFDAADTASTAAALLYYSLGMMAMAGGTVTSAAFFSLQDTRTPVILGILAGGSNVLLDFLLVSPMGHRGLALANALATWGGLLASYLFLSLRLGGLPSLKLLGGLARILLSSLAMAGATLLTGKLVGGLSVGLPLRQQAQGLFLAMATGGALYLFLIAWLKLEEVSVFLGAIRRRLRGS
ncbi:MAG: murein biosynthesis integral membrane protein MurJ [Firmicutes bacterium]|nr:murein biosynthesis integral membrane protein MurJ [Bacillota bacterium]